MSKFVIAHAAAIFVLATTSSSATTLQSRQQIAGDLRANCRSMGVVKLCGNRERALVIAGKPTDLMFGLGADTRPFEMERQGNLYRVKLGNPGLADTDFFYFEEVSFQKVGARYLLTRIKFASSHECDGRPDLRRLDTLDFRRQTLTTELEPAWTASGKRWEYVDRKRSIPTADVYKWNTSKVANLMADTPANEKLCEIYG